MLRIAKELGNSNVADCLVLARTMGLRVTEAAAVSRSQAEYALRTGVYQVKGEAKNGKHRELPLSPEGRHVFERRLLITDRGARLFIQPGEKTHQVVNRMEKFVQHHREKVLTADGIRVVYILTIERRSQDLALKSQIEGSEHLRGFLIVS